MVFPRVIVELSNLARTIVAVIIGVILAVTIFVTLSTSPDHRDLYARQERIENQLQFLTCLLVAENPDAPTIAACQVDGG